MDQEKPQKYPVCLPSDTDGLMRVLRRVKKWRDRAEDPAQLQSLQLARRIDGLCGPLFSNSDDSPSESACAPALCPHFRWPPHRTLPIPPNLDVDLVGRTVKIESALQSSISKHCSQVYVATVDVPHALSSITVILKVYQSSLHKDLDDLNENMETAYWTTVLTPYRHEEWAYNRMEALQGTVVPYVLGFFEVKLPHNEPAIALVFEQVQGHNPISHGDSFMSRRELISTMIRGFIAAYHAMFNCGVAWEDTAMRNIIWPYPPAASAKPDGEIVRETEWVPVCLDFGFARPFVLPWEKASQLGCAFDLLWRDYGYGLDYATVRELVEEIIMRDRDTMDMLDMTSDKDLAPYIQHLLP